MDGEQFVDKIYELYEVTYMCISVLRFQSVVLPVFRDVRDVAEKRCSNLWSLGFVKHMRVKWGFR